ncbi:hypothetical protein B566_EDAN006505 [Ephemera danica]|nr:hypothetical protein B566_EDAN006505 [Ephemera danica]
MSFVREGDDSALLNHLQHRRVAEILGSNIPENEASLLSNGRLTCLICSYRPVFDNITTLAAHRQGKKHIHELCKYLQRKAELEIRAAKETQKTHVYAGLTTKEPAANQPLRRTPCKSRRFCHDRRITLEAATPTANVLISPPDTVLSPNSVVRKYLKSIERSRPLQKAVDSSREGYSCSTTSEDKPHASNAAQMEVPSESAAKPIGPPENPAKR